MSDYQHDDRECTKCGHYPTHWRDCAGMHCEDGYIDAWVDDPINCTQGEEYEKCLKCHGVGSEWWCPKCGVDLNNEVVKIVRERTVR
jgi:hypothetical protein